MPGARAVGNLCRPGPDLLDRLDQRLRPEWFGKIGDAAGFHRGHVDSRAVIPGDVNDRQGNARGFESMPQFNPGFTIQVDIEDYATRCLEILLASEGLGGGKQNAVITVLTQKPLDPLEHSRVIIDDKDDISISQRRYPRQVMVVRLTKLFG
jgi:hypothetical protein